MPEEPVTPPAVVAEPPVSEQPASPAQPAAVPFVPETWPGAFGAYKHSKAVIKLNLGTFVALMVLNILASGTRNTSSSSGALTVLIMTVIYAAASTFTAAAITIALLASVRGKKISLGESFKNTPKFFLNLLVANILVGFISVVSFLLFIIPFFIVAPRLALVGYFLIDKELGAVDAIKASWAATKGNVGKVWGIIGVFIAMALLAITIIGIPFAVYFIFMYYASTVVLYEFLLNKAPATPAVSPAAPVAPAV